MIKLRGFTLIELTTVVVIIAIFAAIALPQVVRHLDDRRVQETAQRIADLYRGARMRAMGQGGAVLVRYERPTSLNGQGLFLIRDRVTGASAQGSACQHTSSPTCGVLPASWDNLVDDADTVGSARAVSRLELASEYGLTNVVATGLDPDGNIVPTLDICFTPMGRTYWSAGGGPFQHLTGIPQVRVERIVGGSVVGLTREVLVLPGGVVKARAVPLP